MNELGFKLGIPQRGYGVSKNIPEEFLRQSVRPVDVHRLRLALGWKFKGTLSQIDLFSFVEPYFPRVDVLHFFNSVAHTRTPWLVTFESLLPYFDSSPKHQIDAVNSLRSESCKRIIAMSNHAVSNFRWKIDRLKMDRYWDEILDKIDVMYPPEPIRESKQDESQLRFVFVAREFYKKGGHVVLRSLSHLTANGFRDWSAVMIGDLNSSPDFTVQDVKGLKSESFRLLASLNEHITHIPHASHSEVIQRMQEGHFLLHPTLQDTYGYVITEAMSCGCVPITCNIRAISELVDSGRGGYLMNVKVDENNNPRIFLSEGMWQSVQHQLNKILIDLAHDWVPKYCQNAAFVRKRIELHHSPEEHQRKIHEIYSKAMK